VAQTLLERSEQDRIEELAARFDPATHPPLRDKVSGDELEIVRGYVGEEIRARLGAELLARASAGLLEPADELPNPFEEAMRELTIRRRGEGFTDAASELAWAARDALDA
jgi:hypothetical protein